MVVNADQDEIFSVHVVPPLALMTFAMSSSVFVILSRWTGTCRGKYYSSRPPRWTF
jgi:hypothetical protein